MILLKIIQLVSGPMYKIIGPENSTRLSQSKIGKFILLLIIGSKKSKVYKGISGIRLKLSKEEAIASGFIHLGVINPFETNIIKAILKEGDVFIDIGAYVDGWHSILASKIVGKTGHVYTFEPVPDYFKKLTQNINLNKCGNITLERTAFAEKEGLKNFYIGGLASSLYREHLNKITKPIIVKVKTLTLDNYIKKKKIKNINLIKIDVEGAEMDVVKGGINLLGQENSPDIIMEVKEDYLEDGNTSEKKLLAIMKKLGYKKYYITEKGLKNKIKGKSELMNVYFSKRNPKFLPIC